MSETGDTGTAPKKKATSINTMLLADLKAVAQGMGIKGAGSMKKAQLVEAIKGHQDDHARRSAAASTAPPSAATDARPAGASDEVAPGDAPSEEREAPVVRTRTRGQRQPRAARAEATADAAPAGDSANPSGDPATGPEGQSRTQSQQQSQSQQQAQQQGQQQGQSQSQGQSGKGQKGGDRRADQKGEPKGGQRKDRDQGQGSDTEKSGDQKSGDQRSGGGNQGGNQGGKDKSGKQDQNRQDQNRQDQNRQDQNRQDQNRQDHDDDGDEEGGRRSRRRRGRERTVGRQGRNEPDTTILEDDVLVPAAGILDVLDNYAFVRTTGYLPGTDDVYLSLSMVRKYGLRRGDALVGQVRHPREGERREKFNPMVRIDSVNGMDPEASTERPQFADFTPIHPADRLRLETDQDNLLGRVVDVAAPIGKGQRGLVVAPPRSGKTEVVGAIASSISRNNPECHLMVVLIDERPEEVTDYQRSIRGEVIASTFDRPAGDHILIAELAVERAKRLVELGHDVVVLMDSLTSLGRAYTSVAPGHGKVVQGGVDPAALHPAKQLFGAARNVEDGGSLTILATAIVETGSASDDAIFEEFAGTANMELVLRGELARRRIFPPVDVVASSTRREEHLLGEEEQEILLKLRTALMDVEPLTGLQGVLARMGATQSNVEFLTQVQRASAEALIGP